MEPLIKAKEAAVLIGLGEKTLKRLAAEGKVPAWRDGPMGHWYFRISSLEAWANSALNSSRRSIPPREDQ